MSDNNKGRWPQEDFDRWDRAAWAAETATHFFGHGDAALDEETIRHVQAAAELADARFCLDEDGWFFIARSEPEETRERLRESLAASTLASKEIFVQALAPACESWSFWDEEHSPG